MEESRVLHPGRPYPLGSTVRADGTNFAIFSESATKVDLCLFDEFGQQTECITFRERTALVWHCLVPGIRAGQLYAYRIDGPWDPERGLRHNHNKLLMDPYARAISGSVDWKGPIYGYDVASGDDSKMDIHDDAASMPRCLVIKNDFDWGGDARPETFLSKSVIYEVHVKGFSINNPEVPEQIRGTYAGLGHEASIRYLKNLGVTAVELLPVHHFIDEGSLVDRGLRNYWGYNTLGFFAPTPRYCSCGDRGGQISEFKQMVKSLHEAGIEVILDVVYNHTAEGNHMGPTLSWKGISNKTYYRATENNPRLYMDYTGTGNTLNLREPQVLKMVMDSLRYWVNEMHVDGFRFDLASALARDLHAVSRLGPFLDTIHQDPTLSTVKLIAEPWDVGDGGYQVGQFPILWAEWNGKYRDTMRRFWKGDQAQLSTFASRITGSSDLYESDGRKPYASINFITAHDGFTLHDLVSYDQKHNEANGENNRDGTGGNESWNMGSEGPTEDHGINALRERQVRNFLATLMLSQGVPLLNGGDEIGRTQRGNNNGYCQDNEISWFDWKLDESRKRLLEFTAGLVRLRLEHPNLHRRNYFHDCQVRSDNPNILKKDIAWFDCKGGEVSDAEWNEPSNGSVGIFLNGRTLRVTDDDGVPMIDASFFLAINATAESLEFKIPPSPSENEWRQILDTDHLDDPFAPLELKETLKLAGRSLKVLSDTGEQK